MNLYDQVKDDLKRDEGSRLKPYRCTAGKLTIGIGRNLDDKGISQQEAEYMLENDIYECVDNLNRMLPWWKSKPEPVKRVLLNMCFNLGIAGLMKFENTLRFIESNEYARAADNMLLSKWATQVGERAVRLAKLILSASES